jgi:hypothetical protein
MKTIYIAGPMTGYPRYNYPAFDEAERHLRELGWNVANPAAMSRAVGFDETKDTPTKEFMDWAIRADVEAVLNADALCVLPGWKESRGAKAEAALAVWRDIPIFGWPHVASPH